MNIEPFLKNLHKMENPPAELDTSQSNPSDKEVESNILITTATAPSPSTVTGASFRFNCNLCDKYSLTREPILNHIKKDHLVDNVLVTEHYSPCFLPPEPKKIITVASPASKFALHFVCNYCDKYYTTKANVKKHIKLVHNFQSVSEEHYGSCIKQTKASKAKPTESARVKPMEFITPLKSAKVTDVGVGTPPEKPTFQLPEFRSGEDQVQERFPSELNKQGAVQKIHKKFKSKKTVAKEKIKYYKDLENILLDPKKNEKLQLWKKSSDNLSPTFTVAESSVTALSSVTSATTGAVATSTTSGGGATSTTKGAGATSTTSGGGATSTTKGAGATSATSGGGSISTTSGVGASSTTLSLGPTSTTSGGGAKSTTSGGGATLTISGVGATSTPNETPIPVETSTPNFNNSVPQLTPFHIAPPSASSSGSVISPRTLPSTSTNAAETRLDPQLKLSKRGRRPKPPDGRRSSKCSLKSCVPCSVLWDCGKCVQCLNKKTMKQKCKLRQCSRVNPKYIKHHNLKNLQIETEVRLKGSDSDLGDNDLGDNEDYGFIKELVKDIVETVAQLIPDTVSCVNKKTELPVVKSAGERRKLYPCDTCGKMFSQFPSAQKHCQAKSDSVGVLCPKCNKTVTKKRNFKRHLESCKGIKVSGGDRTIKCDGCDKLLSSKQRLRTHMASQHGVVGQIQESRILKCPECTFSHPSVGVLKMHISKYHIPGVKVYCQQCDYVCYSRSGMRKHTRSVHKTVTVTPNQAPAPSVQGFAPPLHAVLPHADHTNQTIKFNPLSHELHARTLVAHSAAHSGCGYPGYPISDSINSAAGRTPQPAAEYATLSDAVYAPQPSPWYATHSFVGYNNASAAVDASQSNAGYATPSASVYATSASLYAPQSAPGYATQVLGSHIVSRHSTANQPPLGCDGLTTAVCATSTSQGFSSDQLSSTLMGDLEDTLHHERIHVTEDGKSFLNL